VTLKLVAKYGDACNISAMRPEEYRHKFDVLRWHCDRLGRDYDSIIKSAHVFMTLLEPGQNPEAGTERPRKLRGGISLEEFRKSTFVGDPKETVAYLQSLVDVGTEYFIFYFRNDLTRLDTLQLFAQEVMPALREG
jgi:alkanesulfonate monooxygenase SsuD/methylene tetrahydromethanopterin reductase-like flavin-dependent oxidoreductase (luciferase family)